MSPTSHPQHSEFHATAVVYHGLRMLAERLSHPAAPPDGLLSARVIGEFSAGKTRLLRELLGEKIPPALFPISSLERQTRLPLEITYGESSTLELIERPNDYNAAVIIKTLDAFPAREEISEYDPQQYRLRLTIPEQQLFLPTGDHYGEDDHEPKRLLLIDMPGWNSGQDDIAEGDAAAIMAGYHNLALIFVVNATRLDGQDNHNRLRDFLSTFAEANFVDKPTLLVIITHCPRNDQHRLRQRMRERITALWAGLEQDDEALSLHLLAVDFSEMTAHDLTAFREAFWRRLLSPIHHKSTGVSEHSWIAPIRRWSGNQDLRPRLLLAATRLNEAHTLLNQANQAGDFLPGMNMHRLLGLDATAIQDRLMGLWLRQLHCSDRQDLATRLTIPAPLADEHPLSDWWNQYWQTNLEQALAPTRQFFALAEQAFSAVQPDTPDLREHLATRLNGAHHTALRALDSSFTRLVETAQSLTKESQLERAVATLLRLSLLETRYADYCAWARTH